MTKKNKVYLFVFLLIGVSIASFTLGRYLYSSPLNSTINSTKILSKEGSELINPMHEYWEQRNLAHVEFDNFKPEIEKLINSQKAKNSGIGISYYYRDLNTGLWFGINENERYSPASLFKLPILITFFKRAEKEPDIFTTGLTYNQKEIFEVEEESGFPKEKGKFYTLDELLTHMICYSDNAASLVLMNFLGDSAILEVMRELNFQIEGDYTQNSNFVTVKNYSSILRVLYNSTFLSPKMSEKALELLSQSKYEKGLRAAVPSEIKMAHKYGNRIDKKGISDKAQLHHFAIVYCEGRPYIIGVMTKGGSIDARELIIKQLGELTYKEVIGQNRNSPSTHVFKE
ncbi:MAG: hypothetical protein CFE21_12540 [Bacteroidetes bacterium B1(2017)]|nr:MAG: hypothetical protein CFE21_12540 [Bacteroidetes bacterium B1(2017)]